MKSSDVAELLRPADSGRITTEGWKSRSPGIPHRSGGHEEMSDGVPEQEPLNGDTAHEALPRVARFWWISVVRGAIALAMGLSALVWSDSPERLATFIALYWLAGGLVTLRLAWAMRPSVGFRVAVAAGVFAITAALLVVLREFLSGVVAPDRMVNVFGFVAAAMGTLRLVGAFEIERRTGHRWSLGGLVLGVLELGTGIILIATDAQSPTVIITIGAWALTTGTLLIVEGVRVHRTARAILAPREDTRPKDRSV
jgi:uncharacterized membrane protein HdeD (DUF308 family)